MLSRGGNKPGQRGRAPVDFTYYGSVKAIAETGLLPIALNTEGGQQTVDIYGTQVEAGLYGAHSFRRGIVGVDYRGDYRNSNANSTRRGGSRWDGSNHALSLDAEYQPTRRIMLFLRESAGTTNRAFGGFAAPAFSDQQTIGVPLDEVFDSRVYYAQTSGTIAYQRTARSTFAATGDVFFVRRPDPRLVSMNGSRAVGVYSYKMNRRNEISGVYQYMRFTYPRIYGQGDIHGAAAGLTRIWTRSLTTNLTAGIIRIETIGTQSVTLSPEVAAILGRSRGVAAFHRSAYAPQLGATANFKQDRGSLQVSAQTGVSPGNGVYLTSRRTTLSGGYSYSGVRRLSLGASGGWSKLASRTIDLTPLTLWKFGGGMNYRMTGHLNFTAQLDRRIFDSGGVRGRTGYSAAVGISVSPSRLPLSIW